MRRARAILLTAVLASVGLVPAQPAHAATAVVCAVDGFLDFPLGMPPAPLMPPPSGPMMISSLALVCGGTMLGTGVFSGNGTFVANAGGVDFFGNFSMTVGSTTCSGPFTGITNRVEYAFFVSTGCGQFTIFGVGVPTGVSGMPAITQVHLTAGGVMASGTECTWANGSGCTYIADTSSATGVVISPTAPTTTGASSSWSFIPIPGTGTNLWTGSIWHSPGTWVTVNSAANTSGVIVSN